MPWEESNLVNERLKFVAAWQRGLSTMTELCAEFGISRKSGYKIIGRYRVEGPSALLDRSRAPLSHPNRSTVEVEASVLRVRRAHPTWGSKKILAVLGQSAPELRLPARSTVEAILDRAGVVRCRRARRLRVPSAKPYVDAAAPNDVWSADFKGWFRLGDGTRCDPLTINDVCSRFSLVCHAMRRPQLEGVRKRFELAFREFGLPSAILTDNGPPFGSVGIGHLTRLSVWFLKHAIRPLFIVPGHPEHNGRHERFHRTLDEETASPPKATQGAQQRAFGGFRREYNEDRPHESLGMLSPAQVYTSSPRVFRRSAADFEYDAAYEVRQVRTDGSVKWQGGYAFVGEAVRGERVGLEQVDDEVWHLHIGMLCVGVLAGRTRVIVPILPESEAS